MKMFKKIKSYISDLFKILYIRKELKKKFKYAGNNNKKYRKILTKSIYKSTKINKSYVDDRNNKIMEFEKSNLLNGIKIFIDKYYQKRENQLITRELIVKTKENELNKKQKKKV